MADRWALAPAEDGGVEVAPLGPDGLPAGPVRREGDLAEAVRSRPYVTRWVWRSTPEVYPTLLATGGCEWSGATTSRTPRPSCSATRGGTANPVRPPPRSPGCAAAPCRPTPRRAPPHRARSPRCSSPPGTHVPLEDLVTVYAEQQRRHDRAAHPDRMRLLTAAESAGMLVAAELNRTGGCPGARTCTARCCTNCSASGTRAAVSRAGWPSWRTRCPPRSGAGCGPIWRPR
ncbi:hypothetical protein GCM10020295_35500 [Streptomyces cinereospinus]